MEKPHPNLELLERLDIRIIDACEGVYSDAFTIHYFNPNLPELEGD